MPLATASDEPVDDDWRCCDVANPWLALPDLSRVRPLVLESWRRARDRHLDPERLVAPLELDGSALRDYRADHPLARVMPVISRLLIQDADDDSGILIAVGDASGRLLWVEGDSSLKARAEQMLFVEGAGWSERDVGTSAPGTAIALDHGIQIHAAEHFAAAAQQWSCTAVPVHDLETGSVLGVLDLTGGVEAVAPQTLALVQAAAAVAERELLIQRLRSPAARRTPPRRAPRRAIPPRLDVLGRDTGLLHTAGGSVELPARHAEILALLAWHPQGMSAEELARSVYERDDAMVTLRAEMVRLRKRLAEVDASLVPLARPYRLSGALEVDARSLLGLLDRGAHRAALAAYRPLLPGSTAPGIVAIRAELAGAVRESMLECASPDLLLDYARTADAIDDVEVWRSALTMLPPRSPRRAGVVAHLENLDRELS